MIFYAITTLNHNPYLPMHKFEANNDEEARKELNDMKRESGNYDLICLKYRGYKRVRKNGGTSLCIQEWLKLSK